MSFSKRCTRMWPLFCQLKVLPLDILIQIEYGKTMYKYQNNMLPSIFNTYFNKPTHSYPTRFSSNNNFALTRANSARDKQMLKVIGPSIWLGIPIHRELLKPGTRYTGGIPGTGGTCILKPGTSGTYRRDMHTKTRDLR